MPTIAEVDAWWETRDDTPDPRGPRPETGFNYMYSYSLQRWVPFTDNVTPRDGLGPKTRVYYSEGIASHEAREPPTLTPQKSK